jgi:hypothetical protein
MNWRCLCGARNLTGGHLIDYFGKQRLELTDKVVHIATNYDINLVYIHISSCMAILANMSMEAVEIHNCRMSL